MRTLLCLALLCATATWARPAAAQQARATVQASATVVDPAQARVDGAAATVRAARGGVELSAPIELSGAGSPTVSVRAAEGVARCETVAAGRAGGTWLRCFVPGAPAAGGAVAEVQVTLWVSTAA
jgi:hypothetical protein